MTEYQMIMSILKRLGVSILESNHENGCSIEADYTDSYGALSIDFNNDGNVIKIYHGC